MKNYMLLIGLIFANICAGQTPEKVYSVAKEQRDIDWYILQEKLWNKELKQNDKNPIAWSNYYEAVRAQWILEGWSSEGERDFKKDLDSIVKRCYKTIPKSFEANYLMYRNFNNNEVNDPYFKYLETAYSINPLDIRTYENFITHYELVGDKAKWNEFEEKYFNANLLSGSVYNWGYNLLSELDENAIVFTAGDNDTYSLWGLQSVKKFRPDVTVINTSLMLVEDYRIRKFKELGINSDSIRFSNQFTQEDFNAYSEKLFRLVFKNEKGLPVYVASSAAFQFMETFGENLYITGLAYRYSEEEFDNNALILRNYEKRYLLDYLTLTFAFNIQDKVADQLNAAYLPAFVKLYKHYALMENETAKEQVYFYLTDISKKSGQYEQTMELISDL